MIDNRNPGRTLHEHWWWRHANNLWTYDPQSHTPAARTNWADVNMDAGPIRVSPFVDKGQETFRTLLVTEPWQAGRKPARMPMN